MTTGLERVFMEIVSDRLSGEWLNETEKPRTSAKRDRRRLPNKPNKLGRLDRDKRYCLKVRP